MNHDRRPRLMLTVISLRYSPWSMRAWLALKHAGAAFETKTVELPHMTSSADEPQVPLPLAERRKLGSVTGNFPVLHVDGVPIHEALAICEYAAEAFPEAGLWPEEPLARAQARAVSAEMASGFLMLRTELSSHLFGRVADFTPSREACEEIERVFEIWIDSLERSGGPFLFGRFGIADAMYYPVLGRFRTYGVKVPSRLTAYTEAIDAVPAVRALIDTARSAPRLALYDRYLARLGGDPDAALPAG